MNRYIATFYTHYGAILFLRFCRTAQVEAIPMQVPRALSASCGTCVQFEAAEVLLPPAPEDLEAVYLALEDGTYEKQC